MPRVKPLRLKRKPMAYSCLYDRGVYEVYADNVLMSKHETKRDAEKAAIKKTKAGLETSVYELCAKAYLAILLNSINLEDLLARVNEATASAILGAIASAREFVLEA
jgi:hypothetical protein